MLDQLDNTMGKNCWPLSHCTCKNQFQIDYRFKCEKIFKGELLKGNLGQKFMILAQTKTIKQNPKSITIKLKFFKLDYCKIKYGCLSKDTLIKV